MGKRDGERVCLRELESCPLSSVVILQSHSSLYERFAVCRSLCGEAMRPARTVQFMPLGPYLFPRWKLPGASGAPDTIHRAS